ncbi:septum formation initiator family protein [Streptacidiphilus sp. PB12-B1b]|uniref:FtsB family cell division protein n=1 Tax=Streptacidiphilus sp. PB12-B1b TaxID=2705012 RepID=UPI0015FBBCD4|nr:septum formation initiator family protein [Streptacidiphilus sp. PB12-B1b]QMU75080.1 septum formation initiator family protein [Streptacidiphilus sp. PB12-B1b]
MSGREGGGRAATGRRPRITGRAAVLALVFCSLVAVLAYPTRQFIAQRAQIAQQQAAARQAQAQVEVLRREKARWQDPAYVEAQARERLHYGFPGETPFSAVDPDPGAAAGPSAGVAPQPGAVTQPWYDNMFESLNRADSAQH